jgi:pimeloyl-ACP methyl ester carboxylesterase
LQAHAAQYTYDRIGYGASKPRHAERHLSQQAAHLASLIRFIDADQVILVGHSLGCSIAACLAADEPGLVDGIVMVSPPLDPDLEPASWWRPLLNFPVLRTGIPHALRVSNNELAPLKKQLSAYESRWSEINCPVTVIQGDTDGLVPARNVDYIEEQCINAPLRKVILEHEGHFIDWTRQELIADEIVRIISIRAD